MISSSSTSSLENCLSIFTTFRDNGYVRIFIWLSRVFPPSSIRFCLDKLIPPSIRKVPHTMILSSKHPSYSAPEEITYRAHLFPLVECCLRIFRRQDVDNTPTFHAISHWVPSYSVHLKFQVSGPFRRPCPFSLSTAGNTYVYAMTLPDVILPFPIYLLPSTSTTCRVHGDGILSTPQCTVNHLHV